MSHPRNEADLIARATQNDAAAVRTITRLCNRRLYRIARSVVRDDHEAEDVVQAAYGRAFTSLREFRGESGICTWLARIVLNEALGRLRRQDTVDHISMQDPQGSKSLSLSLIDKQPDPERMVAQREIQRLLERAIDQLPQNFRIVLVMRTIEGMSVEEELLGIRPETVKTRLHRARALLRTRLENYVGPQLTDTFPFKGERCLRLTAKALKSLTLAGRSEELFRKVGGNKTRFPC